MTNKKTRLQHHITLRIHVCTKNSTKMQKRNRGIYLFIFFGFHYYGHSVYVKVKYADDMTPTTLYNHLLGSKSYQLLLDSNLAPQQPNWLKCRPFHMLSSNAF